MALISEVADKIYQIKPEGTSLAHFPRCTVYLVVDDKIALVETGCAVQNPDITEAIQKLGYDLKDLSYILLTHVHADHAGGAGLLARQAQGARVAVHPRTAKLLADPSAVARMMQGWKQIFGADAEERFGAMLPIGEERFEPVEGQNLISLGERELKVIHTPGHDPYHLCFWDSKTGGLFCGDALGAYFSEEEIIAPSSAPGADPILTMQSIEELRPLNPAILFFSHGGTSREVDKILREAAENARFSAEIALIALQKGDTPEEIARKLIEVLAGGSPSKREYLSGLPYWIPLGVEGYRQYYKKENLI
ncbi:MAG: MBL fold metallo-hydrolase [Deltaproteobacteria bacterium]|nr:MBL fold metallo-hydrolase [Deltaproteobacteria bacterium]